MALANRMAGGCFVVTHHRSDRLLVNTTVTPDVRWRERAEEISRALLTVGGTQGWLTDAIATFAAEVAQMALLQAGLEATMPGRRCVRPEHNGADGRQYGYMCGGCAFELVQDEARAARREEREAWLRCVEHFALMPAEQGFSPAHIDGCQYPHGGRETCGMKEWHDKWDVLVTAAIRSDAS